MFDKITPVILTFNEAPNIGRTLEKLRWAKDIVVVDSCSTDDTLSIVAGFPQTRAVQRKFDNHAAQWNFAIKETVIKSEWVLALDADYVLSDELINELGRLAPSEKCVGYEASIKYCIHGKVLSGSAYPPVTVLYRHSAATYWQDGHTQRLLAEGLVEKLIAPIYHDDRKTLSHWVQSQMRYMNLEANKLLAVDRTSLGWADRLRLLRVAAPFVMFFYCLFVKGAILDGKAGVYYSVQRMFSELLLSLFLLQRDIGGEIDVF